MSAAELHPIPEERFTEAMDEVVREAETMRLAYMKRAQGRKFLTATLGVLLALGGAGGFGWFFLMKFDLAPAVLCMLPALAVPILMPGWSKAPIKRYIRDYKTRFMPRMAKALGGFEYSPRGGISRETLGKTGVMPAHDRYAAEDCFIGAHKGVRVIFSEARLYSRKTREPVFQGLLVMLEAPQKIFEGHTIVTADKKMAQRCAGTRWKALSPVAVTAQNPDWDRFVVFSDRPAEAALLVGERLRKELSEAADIFSGSAITCVLFRGKYVFLMIPHQGDMFEPSDMLMPVTTKLHAQNCRKEIERILEIVDLFEIYGEAGRGQQKIPL